MRSEVSTKKTTTAKGQEKNHSYKNGESIHKINSRNYILDEFRKLITHTVNSLTLPERSFELEKSLMGMYPIANMTFCEVINSVHVFQKHYAKETLNAEGRFFNCFKGDIFHSIGFAPYNLIWLDLMNLFTRNIFKNLGDFMARENFLPEGILAFTFSASIETYSMQEYFSELARTKLNETISTLPDFKSRQLPEILRREMSEKSNMNFEIIKVYSYGGGQASIKMYMYIFKWSKT